MLAPAQQRGTYDPWDLLVYSTEQEAGRIAIVGPPGAGKSTLLQFMAVVFASRDHGKYLDQKIRVKRDEIKELRKRIGVWRWARTGFGNRRILSSRWIETWNSPSLVDTSN